MHYFLFIFSITFGSLSTSNPVELGDVQWLRSLDEAQNQSKDSGKPILILFQEVPGCATCRNYGNDVLTDPLIVEGIETEFVPLAIYNNKKGNDAKVLQMFNEPSWNNPVVRAVDEDLGEISPRLNGNYSKAGLMNYMVGALIRERGKAPEWLQLLADEWNVSESEKKTAVYSMYCFWTGEAHFGRLNGVLATEPGFANGKEVVKVVYDSRILSKSRLDAYAKSASCRVEQNANGYRPDRTPKYYLSNSKYAAIQMTSLQKCRVNSALGEGQDPGNFLSPRQLSKLTK